MFVEYQHGSTLAHRLDPRAKLVAFTVVVVTLFLFAHPVPNVVMALAALGLLVALRVPWATVRPVFGPLIPMLILIGAFAAIGYGPGYFADADAARVLVYLLPGQHLPVTAGGVTLGATLALRILVMVALSIALTASTPIEAFVAMMRSAHVPFALVFMVMIALRFVPTMQRRTQQVLDAQRARGARIDAGGPIGRIRAHVPIMVPLLADGVRMSEDLAAAMLNRGYGASKHATSLVVLRLGMRDGLVVLGSLCLLAAAISARAAGWWQL